MWPFVCAQAASSLFGYPQFSSFYKDTQLDWIRVHPNSLVLTYLFKDPISK